MAKRMRRVRAAGMAAAVTAGMAAAPAMAQNLVTNGDFETGTLAGWTQGGYTAANAVVILPGLMNGYFLSSGPWGSIGTLSQTLTTMAGARYAISYTLSNYADGQTISFRSSFAGQTLQTLTNPAFFNPTTYSFTATAPTGSSVLLFELRNDPWAFFLDNVSVTFLSGPDPLLGGLNPLVGPGAPANIAQVAGGLTNAFSLNIAAANPYLGLYDLDPATRQHVLGTMTGEVTTGIQSAALLVSGQFLDTMGSAARGAWGGCDDPGRPWASWATMNGTSSRMGGDGATASNGISMTSGGVSAGIGYCSPTRIVGLAVTGGSTNWTLANGLGSGDAASYQAGLYAIQRFGAAYILGAGAIGTHNTNTHRSVPAFNESLGGGTTAQNYAARVEAGHRFGFGAFGATPFVAASWQTINVSGFNETAALPASVTALSYAGHNAATRRSEVGIEGDTRLPGTTAALYARLAWVHDFDRSRDAQASFTSLPGSEFIVRGARPDGNWAMARGGIAARLTPGALVRAELGGEFFGNVSSVSGTARLSVAF